MTQTSQPVDEPEDLRKDRYLAMLSHDLRSALANVITGLEAMDSDKLDPALQLHRIGALSSARHVSTLIDGIIDIRAIDKNDFYLDVEAIRLDEFLQGIHRAWLGATKGKGLSFRVDKIGTLPSIVETDRARVTRVLGNLLDNAIKYTDEGEVSLGVEFGEQNMLIFQVQDSGTGFSKAALDQLFEFRGRPADSSKPGTGLGLHIAKSLVDNMGGDIVVQNIDGKGARITVQFPVFGSPTMEPGEGSKSQEPSTVAVLPNAVLPDLSGLNILLAEDNATNQLVVTQMLSAMGATFDVASDGVEAIEKFDEGEYDLALLDIEMPRMSGIDVIRHIRTQPGPRMYTPVIALTAYALREHRKKIAAAGSDGLIAKPILGIEDFGQSILRYVEGARGRDHETGKGAKDGMAREGVIDRHIIDNLEKSVGSERMGELFEKVYADLINVRDQIRSGCDNADAEKIAAASHVLISVAGAIGALDVQNSGQILNRAAHIGDQEQIQTQANACLTGIAEILSFVAGRIES